MFPIAADIAARSVEGHRHAVMNLLNGGHWIRGVAAEDKQLAARRFETLAIGICQHKWREHKARDGFRHQGVFAGIREIVDPHITPEGSG